MKLWKIALLLVAAAANPLSSIPTATGVKNDGSNTIEHPLLAKGALPFHKLPKDQSRNPVFTLLPVQGGIDNNPNAWPTFFDDLKNGFKAKVVSDKKLSKTEAIDKALEWASNSMSANLPKDSKLVVKSAVRTKSNGLFHIHLRQVIDENGSLHEIYNADVNINMDAYGNIISFGQTVFTGSVDSDDSESSPKIKTKKHRDILAFSDFRAEIDSAEAFRQLLRHFMEEGKSDDDYGMNWIDTVREEEAQSETLMSEDETGNRDELFQHPNFHKTRPMRFVKSSHDEEFKSHASMGYMQDVDGKTLTKVWNVQADFGNHWVESNVCVKSGKVKSIHDWVSHANYKVYPLGVNDPEDGARRLVRQPEDPWASPQGWLDPKEKHPRSTHGNNVWAQANWEGKSNPRWKTMKRPIINSANETFAYKLDLESSANPHEYVNAATVNLFYWNNILHDLSYQYGFDEESGNFQDDNFDRGGLGNDAVMAMSQAGEGTDNANFATPPDGGRPRMNMYLWDLSSPYRDGDLDAGKRERDLIFFEY